MKLGNVKKVEYTEAGETRDITVENSHCYFANNVLVHNCKYVISENLIGPIIYEAKVEQLKPEVRLVRTNYSKNYRGNIQWTTMVSSLEKDKERIKLIARWAIKDAEDGHMVLILFSQIKPILELIKEINRRAEKTLAFPFYGGMKKKDQDANIELARRYKIKILVGNSKMLSTGVNIPRASCLYEVAMSSNKENAEQRMTRILTPHDTKPRPIIRFFLDDLNVRKKCMANEWWSYVHPKLKPIMSEKDKLIIKSYFSGKKSISKIEF